MLLNIKLGFFDIANKPGQRSDPYEGSDLFDKFK